MKRRLFAQGMGLAAMTLPLSSVLVGCGGGADPVRGTGGVVSSGGVDTTYAISTQPNARTLVDAAGRVYAIDASHATLTRQDGTTSGPNRPVGDVTAYPVHAGFDASGNAYVLDKAQNEVRVYAAGGALLRRFGKTADAASALSQPSAVAVHEDRVYVADSGKHRVQVFALDGTRLASFGTLDPREPVFNYPADIDIGADGLVHVLQSGSSLVTVHDVQGTLVRRISLKLDANGQRRRVCAIAVGASGRLHCSDFKSGNVLTLDADGSLLSQYALTDTAGKSVAARYLAAGPGSTLYISGVAATA